MHLVLVLYIYIMDTADLEQKPAEELKASATQIQEPKSFSLYLLPLGSLTLLGLPFLFWSINNLFILLTAFF